MDWQEWHHDYDDADSSVSRRLVQVRARVSAWVDDRAGDRVDDRERPLRLLNLCCGDGRDTIPALAGSGRDVDACLVELDPGLAGAARRTADEAGVGVEVRTGDAATPGTYADRLPVDVLMLVGVLGNVSDADAERTIAACASMIVDGGEVMWSRSNRFRAEPTHGYADPAEWVRDRFEAHGFETRDFVVPEVDAWRLGVSVLRRPSRAPLPETLFSFVR